MEGHSGWALASSLSMRSSLHDSMLGYIPSFEKKERKKEEEGDDN